MPDTSTVPEIRLDFSYFDNLYNGHGEQYTEMLDLYLQEYSIYKKTISQAVATGNEAEFRKAKHKIIYSLHLLKLETIKQHLDEIGQKISALRKSELAHESKVLDEVFDEILEKLAGKRAEII